MMITASNGFIDQSERYAYDNTGASLKKYVILHKGELAYNHGASKLRPYGSCFALDVDNARVPFVYHCFSTSSCDPYFLSTILNSRVVEHQLRRLISSGARMDGLLNISYSDYSNIYITLPTLDEQKKITQLLRTLDGLISLHQRQTQKLRELKKGLLQKMFPREGESVPRLRFPGFTTHWEQQKLSDVASITMGQSPDGSTYSTTPQGHILIQGNADLSHGWVSPRVWTTQVTKTCDAGDIIMSVRAPAGAIGRTQYNAVIGRGVAAIKGNDFIYQSLARMDDIGYWRSLVTGSTFESINSTDLKMLNSVFLRYLSSRRLVLSSIM